MRSFWFFCVIGCQREVNLNVTVVDERAPLPVVEDAFLSEIPDELKHLMDARCMRCHNDWGDTSESVLDSLEALELVIAGEPDESQFYLKLLDDPLYGYQMPRQFSPINEQLLENIERWIALGAMNNDSFQAQVVPPYQGFCADCHPDFTDGSNHPNAIYNALLSLEFNGLPMVVPSRPNESLFYLKMTDPPYGEQMPVSFPLLSEDELTIVYDWLAGN